MPTITIAGYAPETSSHSRALELFRRRLADRAPDMSVEITWNIVEQGLPVGDLLTLVENGKLSICYLSTSYLTDRVPELALLDTPYRFSTLVAAHQALDGEAGRVLSQQISDATGLEVLGFWDNGFRHLSNRLRSVRTPEDCQGMRVRIQPNPIHVRMVEAWGAIAVPTDLRDGIDIIASGQVDAQENPLSNTVAYGVDRHHRHVTLTRHVYGARGLYVNRDHLRAWPPAVREAVAVSAREAIEWQRAAAATEEDELVGRLSAQGIEVIRLDEVEIGAFVDAVKPLRAEIDSNLPGALLEAVG